MSLPGVFVSLDGPGGTGKSTTLGLVQEQLAAAGRLVHVTAEPSRTPIGELIRASTDTYNGLALACLVAGDRHHHLAAEIGPQLRASAIVISDRYLPASLVLQRIDGLTWETIWQLNMPVTVPDLAVILSAEPSVIAERLIRRGTHSRFERPPDAPAVESRLYADTTARLTHLGWPICTIDVTTRTPGDVAAIVTDRILALPPRRSGHGG